MNHSVEHDLRASPSARSDDTAALLESLMTLSHRYAQLVQQLERRLAGIHGLSFLEFRLLQAIEQSTEQRASYRELADTLGHSASQVLRSILPLEKIGMVSRNPTETQYMSQVALSLAGQRVAHESAQTVAEVLLQMMPDYTDSQQALGRWLGVSPA